MTSQECWDLPRLRDCNTELWFTGADRCIHCDGIQLLAFNSNDGRRHRGMMVFFVLLYDQCQLKSEPTLIMVIIINQYWEDVTALVDLDLKFCYLNFCCTHKTGAKYHSNHCSLIFQAAVRRTGLCHAIVLWMDWSLDPDGSLLLSTGPAGMILNATIWDVKAFVVIISCTV